MSDVTIPSAAREAFARIIASCRLIFPPALPLPDEDEVEDTDDEDFFTFRSICFTTKAVELLEDDATESLCCEVVSSEQSVAPEQILFLNKHRGKNQSKQLTTMTIF